MYRYRHFFSVYTSLDVTYGGHVTSSLHVKMEWRRIGGVSWDEIFFLRIPVYALITIQWTHLHTAVVLFHKFRNIAFIL